LIELIKS